MNLKQYDPASPRPGFEFIEIPLLVNDKPTWHHHRDLTIDAAIIQAPQFKDYIQAAGIPLKDFPTTEEMSLMGPGDEVASIGLMPAWPGNRRNYPIFKFGHLSTFPEEPVDIPVGECAAGQPPLKLTTWFLSLNQVPGSSGASVFYAPLITMGKEFTVSGRVCVWQLHLAHFGGLFWPTPVSDGCRAGFSVLS